MVFSLKKNCFVKQEGLLPHGGFQGHSTEFIQHESPELIGPDTPDLS